MLTDLHMHSVYSDGEYDPLKLVTLAREAGVSTMAIADHNNIEGIKIAIANNPYKDMTIIPAVEFTAKSSSKINIHILGFNVDLYDKELNDLTDAYTADSKRRILSNIELLRSEYGLTFKDEDIEKLLSSIGNIGRPELALLCKKYGYVTTVAEAFDNYFNPIKAKVVKKNVDPTDEALIKYIIDAGGVPCLAHPLSLKMSVPKLREYIRKLMGYGLMAVEAYHSDCPKELNLELLRIADEYGLKVSVGSDYHGPTVSPKISIGSGRNNNLNIEKPSILELFTEVKGYEGKS